MDNRKIYNMIICGGSIPPMIAALESIANGYETYAYIGRGRLYNGIAKTPGFHNLGFDTALTLPMETEELFSLAVDKIRGIKKEYQNAFFNFYVDESRAMKCAAIAANAGLGKADFHVYMTEDGIDTYKKFDIFYGGKTGYRVIRPFIFRLTKRVWFSDHAAAFITDKLQPFVSKPGSKLKKRFDKQVWKDFVKTVQRSQQFFDTVMSREDNLYSNPAFAPDYKTPFAIATLDNFTYMLQNKGKIDSILRASGNADMLKAFGVTENCPEHYPKPEIVSRNVDQRINALSEEQRNRYLTLMFDAYREEIGSQFERAVRYDQPAPDRKLIYVSSRFDTMFIKPATDRKYGIGGMDKTDTFVYDYTNLEEKYKSIFLFENEDDYSILADAVKRNLDGTDAPQELVQQAKAKVFNLYSDYVFIIKMLYRIYGGEYDLVVKNHPRTDLGTSFEWSDSYRLTYSDGKYLDCGKCLDEALTEFFKSDTTGRYVGVLNGSLSTENFEYLGKDVSFGGQPSSVYNGLSDNANILFITTDSDGDITGRGTAHFGFSAISELYDSGALNYTDSQGIKQNTAFYNTGNTLRACSQIAEKAGEEKLAVLYRELFGKWMTDSHPGAESIDIQGFEIK
ncbi:MAG: hypothetical protein IJD80_00170 [Oscillospiraceae bacterium]|nr:hypothetical protein [Oscillospiraceae bacterium]